MERPLTMAKKDHRDRSKIFPLSAIVLLLAALLAGCFAQVMPPAMPTAGTTAAVITAATSGHAPTPAATPAETAGQPDHDGYYTSPAEVAAYLHAYQTLPANYIGLAQQTGNACK